MPLLLYCVAPESAPATALPGLGGIPVESIPLAALQWFFSELADPPVTRSSNGQIVADARAFNAVLQDLFSRQSGHLTTG